MQTPQFQFKVTPPQYRWLWALFSLGLMILIWYLIGWIGDFPAFIFPLPHLVWARFIRAIGDGSLVRHTVVTLSEVLAGLLIGVSSATIVGYLLAKSPQLERIISPFIVASQSVPVVAIAPSIGALIRV